MKIKTKEKVVEDELKEKLEKKFDELFEEEKKKGSNTNLKTENGKELDNHDNTEEKKSKEIHISGIPLWRIFAYFIIYSIAGFVIETIFGTVTKGLVESRQSFLYGPFCSIYGLGACVMIVSLQKLKKSYNRLFLGGFLVGSLTEYLVSYLGEMLLHVKWWDYSNLPFNINGRICVAFSVFWGILAMYLLGSLNPKIDKLIDFIKTKVKNEKVLKTVISIVIIAMAVDCIITGVAIKCFEIRKIHDNHVNVQNIEKINEQYEMIYGNEKVSKFIYKFWGDDKMILTFPNLKIKDKDGNIVYFDSLCPGCKRYYLKVYEKYNK
jgi:uncharacterized membrane protein